MADIYAQLLQYFGYETRIAASEEEALTILKDEHIDLLVLSGRSYSFLEECRSVTNDIHTPLILVIDGRTDSFYGFIWRPKYPTQAHAYIQAPPLHTDLLRTMDVLLKGISQQKPGTEGYIRYKTDNVAFEYPAFWQQTNGYIYGPYDCEMQVAANIEVRKSRTPITNFLDMIKQLWDWSKLEEWKQAIPQRKIQIAGMWGEEIEYVWAGVNLWTSQKITSRIVFAIITQDKIAYILRFQAAENVFNEFRSVYDHLLETFEILS